MSAPAGGSSRAVSPGEMSRWLQAATGLKPDATGRIPTRQAAQALGVSQRTIQRALKNGSLAGRGKLITHLATTTPRPSPKHAKPPSKPLYSPLQIQDHLRHAYGYSPANDGSPDLQLASQSTGVSVRQLEHLLRHGARSQRSRALVGIGAPWTASQLAERRAQREAEEHAFFTGLSRRPYADVSGDDDASPQAVRAKLAAAYGQAANPDRTGKPRDVDIDVAKAAKGLGVTSSTVKRWLRDGLKKPSASGAFRKLAKKSRDAAKTAAGRAAAVSGDRARQMMTVSITGIQSVSLEYATFERTCNFPFTDPNAHDAFNDAYTRGGVEGARAWLMNNSDIYYPDWYIGDVSHIDINLI